MEVKLKNGKTYEIGLKPYEGELFKVNPSQIDRSKFNESLITNDDMLKLNEQASTLRIIQEAFAYIDRYPEYATPFYTFIPEKSLGYQKIKVKELKKYANDCGGRMANWVDWALGLAQWIQNGESWKVVCNTPDFSAKYGRMIVWKNGGCRLVGGGRLCSGNCRPSNVYGPEFNISDEGIFCHTVPLVRIEI